jgi:hypothetical protein
LEAAPDATSKQLDEYFAAIRTTEKELATSDAWLDRPKPKVNVEVPQDIAEPSELLGRILDLMNLIPLMLQTDSTRVFSPMIQDHGVVPNIARVQSGHHPLSHPGQDPAKIDQLKIIESGILSTFSSQNSCSTIERIMVIRQSPPVSSGFSP